MLFKAMTGLAVILFGLGIAGVFYLSKLPEPVVTQVQEVHSLSYYEPARSALPVLSGTQSVAVTGSAVQQSALPDLPANG